LEAVEAVKDLQVVLPPQSSLHDHFNVQPGWDERSLSSGLLMDGLWFKLLITLSYNRCGTKNRLRTFYDDTWAWNTCSAWQKLGIRVAMLTGDSSATAEHAHKKVKLCFLIFLTDFVKSYHTYLMEIEMSFWQ
jgi:hypothetical protein